MKSLRGRDDFKAVLNEMKTIDFTVQPAAGFRSSVGWLPNGSPTTDERAPRYLLSTVLACTTGRGTSIDEALANLRRSAAADGSHPAGTIYFERNGDVRSTTREWAFRNAARKHTDGEHVLTVLARANDAVQTIARVSFTVTVRNANQTAHASTTARSSGASAGGGDFRHIKKASDHVRR